MANAARWGLIAAKMCDTTEAFYREVLKPRVLETFPDHEFTTLATGGGTPYFRRAGKKDAPRFVIAYSESNIEQTEGPLAHYLASRWITFDEITVLGYANGVATPERLLVHTMCHELAHFLVALDADRDADEKAHGETFYSALDAVYERGWYDWLREELMLRLRRAGVRQFRQVTLLPELANIRDYVSGITSGSTVTVVYSASKGGPAKGNVVKLGRRRALIQFRSHEQYYVPFPWVVARESVHAF